MLLERGYLTDIRKASAGAMAARYLSRQDSTTVGILGAGVQAGLQLQAISLLKTYKRSHGLGTGFKKSAYFANAMSDRLKIHAKPVAGIAYTVSAADILVTTKPSTPPLIQSDCLKPGQHIRAMGADQHHTQGLRSDCIVQADLYVPDRQTQTSTHCISERRGCHHLSTITPSAGA